FQRATSRGSVVGSAGRVADLRRTIKDVKAGWRNAPGIMVADDFDGLPAEVRKQARADGAKPDEIVAAWHDGSVWLVANHPQFTTRSGIENAIFDEAWGYYGMRLLFGMNTLRPLNHMSSAMVGTPGILRYARKHGIDLAAHLKG